MQSLIVLLLMSLAGLAVLTTAATAVAYGAGFGWTRGAKRAEKTSGPRWPVAGR